ncbi:sushi, von Willebrand factor type A, EGF and pentraxin domain-containing protein 1 [Strongylocentrotus purpuratus]|uniref:Sushi, von Willebrand factor type A, EGF and pentraxin domain-containing protein 1-like n=1 Tax=Strongylocentrotus purpuratus TaxID=7668 RepID=A0A7M7HGE8_STRPU|nr:sushi, von Willebrand factor type A, EGF and pentraxin domain-containing protein 1 [Strongylocentrotus purpuratus]
MLKSTLMLLLFFHLGRGTIRANAQGISEEGGRFKDKLKELFDTQPVSELVFILDSSGSVAQSDFIISVEFLKFASKIISVSASTTRVAVISYSSCNQIHIRVNYISSPENKNKCTFDNDLTSVNYHPGGTCTAGALEAAGRDVLSHGRPGAQRVVMLLTDGASNDGGPPHANAQKLKSEGVKIFTIGIGSIKLSELNAIATSVDEYVYILADFGDVRNLATVVKDDIKDYDAYFDTVSADQCGSSCDSRALCACATRSGSTLCVCEAGFTGDGVSCQECLIGTYKTAYGDGPCTPCPTHSRTSSVRSLSQSECQCLDGYEGNPGEDGGTCQSIRCPDLNNVDINSVIMDECDTTFGSTCQFQCRDEYRPMAGQETITCLDTKQWSGNPLQCEKITCGILPDLNHADRIYSSPDRSIGSVCELRCEPGYEFKRGAITNVTCQRGSEISAQWSIEDDEQDPCKKVSCPVLYVDNPKRIDPAGICLEIPKFEQVCTYDCKRGYQAEGTVDSVTCLADGTWSIPAADITCRDIEPPTLTCPEDISNPTDIFMPISTINWEVPEATDNTPFPVKLRSTHSPPYRFDINTTVVTYSATDLAGNVATCSFNVTVRDEEPPRLTNCTSEVTFQDIGLDPFGDLGIDEEEWNTSQFNDNSGTLSNDVLGVPSGSRFPLGDTEVVSRATDPSGNTQDCNVTIRVSKYHCEYYPPPLNGAVACVDSPGGQLCRISCQKTFHFTKDRVEIYACIANESGQHLWSRSDGDHEPLDMPWPDCAKRRRVRKASLKTGFRYDGTCFNETSQKNIRDDFISVFDFLQTRGDLGPCSLSDTQCSFENVNVQCSQTQRRKRRQVIDGSGGIDVVEITFTLLVEITETVGPDVNVLDYLDAAVNSVQESVANGNVTINVDGIELSLSDDPIVPESEYSILCDVGHIPSNGSCVPCAPGNFENQGVCERCPVGTYQDEYGNTTCKDCPLDTSTAALGARSINKCKALCHPGTYSTSGLESCNACPQGTYEPGRGSTSCTTCPDGLTTWTIGNSDVEHCTNLCPRGTFSPTGFAPCQECPKGSYQPAPKQTSCTLCPGDLYTHHEGAHAIEYCQVINECVSNPCADGATCVDVTHGYDCVCPPGFAGDDCQLDIDECFGNDVCLNNATCTNLVNAYVCECANGFKGENCQINIDDCLTADCRFGSICVDGIASYTCECAEGFAGEHCEINLYDCASDPCRNGASCIDLKSNFSCCCAPGYTGRLCELDSNHCQSSPCHGDATCRTTRNSYICTCPSGFQGRNCEINVNECLESAYCLNGGTCQDMIDGYRCICPLGFNGDHCQTELPKNYDLSFPTARTADRVGLEGVLPDLYEFTLAFWMKTSDKTNFGTPISYATRGSDGASDMDNTLTLQDYNSFVFFVNGQSAFTYVRANGDTNWHYISVVWTSETGEWVFYLDGSQAASGTGLSTGTFVKGRGMFVVGQEQDTYNGSYVVKESFIGSLSQVNIWDYSMTRDEIQSLQSCCSSSGNALSWAQLSTGLRGALRRSEGSEICNGGACRNQGDCRNIECQQGAVCGIQNGQPVCRCPDGFTGRLCQFDINECSVNNGGCDHHCQNTVGSFICSCRQGYALQLDQKTCNSVSFCKHNGKFHSAEDSWEEGCNACACQDGRAECSPKLCPGLDCQGLETEVVLPGDCCPVCLPEMKTCSVSNEGHYETFDGYTYDQHGECRYVLTHDYSGTSNFEVHMEHQFLNANQTHLGVRVLVYIDCLEVKIDVNGQVFVQDEAVGLPYAHRNPANVRIAHVDGGRDVEVFSNKGLTVTWSQTGGVSVNLTVTHGADVKGLCGNMNGNKKDDKMTRQGIRTSKNKELVHSWKVDGYKHCKQRNTRPMKFGYLKIGRCSSVSYKDFGLAFRKCRVFFKNNFKRCVSEVDPKPYITNCIEDTCTCGVRQPCHCEAISSYVNECRRHLGEDIEDWRSLSNCALQCPPTMSYDECGPPCLPTCEDPDGQRCTGTTACVAGCLCFAGQVFHNGACISRSLC